MKIRHLLFSPLAALFLLASCSKDTTAPAPESGTGQTTAVSSKLRTTAITQTFSEGFESGSKTAYAISNVTLGSGSWSMDDALIGNTTSDHKAGSQSVRIRNTGTLGMNFNVAAGASTVTVKYAVYGTDGSSAFQLWASSNSGSSYTQVGGTITASSAALNTATFTVNQAGTLRFQLRKTSGGTNRINIDDFIVNSYDNGSTGGGTGGSTGDNSNLLMGNPSGATGSIVFPANYLMDQTYFTESYNRDRGTPNWVSWYVGSSSLGATARTDAFRADLNLPSGWYQVGSTSYSGSGFDRGHNCPSADRTTTVTANEATFLMTNMIPQAPNNNQQTWANLENYARSLVAAGNEVYIVMGSYGTGGTGSNGFASTINSGHVTVPSNVWKVVVVLPNGNSDLSRVTSSTRVIAVNTPNINTTNSDWKTYRCSVRSIESATGYNLLSALPQSVQDAVETRVDNL
ncbi:DNA/RNA non-specific endonuclease [Mucilaginibacter aquariorum]|uniref:DNA/RNA non-specific endonuclease n=1 Tax=Mucilaginibacter aquariorum TaxID=2967225 RepID=A0ABT1SY06_9SPHI|nr:DNA/RNA non-specific endonuclease [Mucilaginibacter aquariorum]MCQ6957235.1 DNA/RNA non-specific endonuclease [Mucilaginibacter aquariorum]